MQRNLRIEVQQWEGTPVGCRDWGGAQWSSGWDRLTASDEDNTVVKSLNPEVR